MGAHVDVIVGPPEATWSLHYLLGFILCQVPIRSVGESLSLSTAILVEGTNGIRGCAKQFEGKQ